MALEDSIPFKKFILHQSYSTEFPIFDKPKIIGYWSLDKFRKLHWDSSQLRYYTPPATPNVNYDLTKHLSFDGTTLESLDDEKLEHILQWLKRNYKKLLDNSRRDKWLQPDFILYRGIFAKFVKTLYVHEDRWTVCAAKFKGTIYLCSFVTDEQKRWRENTTEMNKNREVWGMKFEQYVLSEAPGRAPNPSRPISVSEQFCAVFQARLNNHNLVYGAQMDGVCSNEKLEDPLPLDKLEFIELKTHSSDDYYELTKNWWQIKFIGWWAQSYLTGIKTIIYGVRDDSSGVVQRLKEVSVSNLATQSEKRWKATISLNCTDEFLKFVKRIVTSDYDKVIYKFEKISKNDIVVTKLEPSSKYAFLPDWYIRLAEK